MQRKGKVPWPFSYVHGRLGAFHSLALQIVREPIINLSQHSLNVFDPLAHAMVDFAIKSIFRCCMCYWSRETHLFSTAIVKLRLLRWTPRFCCSLIRSPPSLVHRTFFQVLKMSSRHLLFSLLSELPPCSIIVYLLISPSRCSSVKWQLTHPSIVM